MIVNHLKSSKDYDRSLNMFKVYMEKSHIYDINRIIKDMVLIFIYMNK